MDAAAWRKVCYEALGVPGDLPADERRGLAERTLLESTDQSIDILGLGAAQAAIDLVVRHGEAGDLNEVMLLWEQQEYLPPGLIALGDQGTLKATICAKKLLHEVVSFAERGRAD